MQELIPYVEKSKVYESDHAIERLRQIRATVVSSDELELVDAIAYVEAVETAARARNAASVMREATQTRILAQRRLGELMLDDPAIAGRLGGDPNKRRERKNVPGNVDAMMDLARVPLALFKETIAGMIDEERACLPNGVVRRAKLRSLKKVEPGIYQAYEGSYFYASGNRRVLAPTGTLDGARRGLKQETGLRSVRWHRSSEAQRLDNLYGHARQLSNAISLLRDEEVGSEMRAKLAQAEVLQMKVAELLYAAYNDRSYEARHGS